MEVFVSAWVGSTNLGDELVFRAMAAKLKGRGTTITAASISPAATAAAHQVKAVPSSNPAMLLGAMMRADRMVLGGGGLLQDQTSSVNLPYHLWRPAMARYLRTAVAGIGLGAGPLQTRGGRRWVQAGLRHARAITVRDRPSADLLAELGLAASVSADLAWSLPAPTPTPVAEHFVKPATVVGEKLKEFKHRTGKTGAPILNDAIAFVECEVREIACNGGDHAVVIGEVVEAGVHRDEPALTLLETGWHYGG